MSYDKLKNFFLIFCCCFEEKNQNVEYEKIEEFNMIDDDYIFL